VGPAPDVHLLLAPALARIVLVEPDEIAVITLVERLVFGYLNAALAELVEHNVEGTLRADQHRGERDVEPQPLCLELAAGGARFGDALLAQIDVAPAGEQVLEIPFALAMAHQHEKTVGHGESSNSRVQKSSRPSTSAME